jgi:hypothetical protein
MKPSLIIYCLFNVLVCGWLMVAHAKGWSLLSSSISKSAGPAGARLLHK